MTDDILQDVNLLATPVRKRPARPTARQLGVVMLAVALVGMGAGLWYQHRHNAAEHAVRMLNAEIDELILSLEERSYSLAERNAAPALVAELQRREREAEDKSRVLDLLSGESVGNTEGFSGHLAALGRRHPRDLWLDRIVIGDGGRRLALRGLTLDADLVPRFLHELQREPGLAGTAFASFTLAGDDEAPGPMRFALATACEAGEAQDAGAPCLPFGEAEPQP